MSEQTKKAVKSIIDSNKQAIKSSEPKVALKTVPALLTTKQEKDRVAIYQALKKLQDQYNELLPFVKGMKKHIPDITETTHICAAYLLLCRTFQSWNSLFLLAEHGEYSAVFSILRKIRESLMLMDVFAIESSKNERKYLDKWCSGKIIPHSAGRKLTNKYYDEFLQNPKIDMQKVQGFLYEMESQHAHNSYASILECISPFIEDYDFEGFTAFHRTKSALKHIKGIMSATNIELKGVYSLLSKDQDGYEKVNEILLKYDPNINQSVSEEIIEPFSKSS